MRSFDPRERRREVERAEAVLAAVDRALETREPDGGHGGERKLSDLALALRAGAPRPRGAFEAELERRMAADFAGGRADAARPDGKAARPGDASVSSVASAVETRPAAGAPNPRPAVGASPLPPWPRWRVPRAPCSSGSAFSRPASAGLRPGAPR